MIGVNRTVDGDAAEEMAKLFLEVIAAPGFDEAARAKFAAKKNLRLVEITRCAAKVGGEKRVRRDSRTGH